MDNPVFSIIIPSFNHSHFLEDCFNSLFAQKMESWEAILVNDGSTDSTKEIGERLAEKDVRIKYIGQENNGLSVARNRGISLAKGEFLLFLDADDWLESGCLSTYLTETENNSEFDLYRCGYAYWDRPRGRKFHTHLLNQSSSELLPNVLSQNIGPCHSILIRRFLAKKLGGFDPNLKSCEDWDYWIRAGKMGARMFSIQDYLVAYRYVPTSMSRNPVQMYQALKEVSFRAVRKEPRIESDLPFNKDSEIDIEENLKFQLLRCIGVYLMQGNVSHSVDWFLEEKEKWNWKIQLKDFEGMNTYLSFRYFLERKEIDQILVETLPKFEEFFLGIGLSGKEKKKAIKFSFGPQLKRRNHYRYGKLMGALVNRLTF
ncbi:glycosyltransferase [Rhodonellum sp.]|uniref:glycosyltransferase n=1 Tax=Rhodonellum sp. TaxID=2231180 RepID=UPI00271CC825|nr:glycosyltransferase [Rhodonellum sp.]MDO9553107.1 glycosyltransferase [Rhodonellum sp.]